MLQAAAVTEGQLLQSCQLPKGLWQLLQAAAVAGGTAVAELSAAQRTLADAAGCCSS